MNDKQLEETTLNAALAQSEDLFRERVRAEFMYWLSTNADFKREIERQVEKRMRAYRRQIAAHIAQAFEQSIYGEEPNQ